MLLKDVARQAPADHRNQRISSHSDPVLFQVNRESRKFAMKRYQTCEHYKSPRTNFVNFEIDTFYISLENFDAYIYEDALSGIEFYLFDDTDLKLSKADLLKVLFLNVSFFVEWDRPVPVSRNIIRFIEWWTMWAHFFPNLKKLTLEIHWQVSTEAQEVDQIDWGWFSTLKSSTPKAAHLLTIMTLIMAVPKRYRQG